MVGYKIWLDTKHYIHKDTTDAFNVSWTTERKDAKVVSRSKYYEFFFQTLGFSINESLPDSLKTRDE